MASISKKYSDLPSRNSWIKHSGEKASTRIRIPEKGRISEEIRIETTIVDGCPAGVTLDLSDKPERMIALFDALEMGRLAAFKLTDRTAGDTVTLALSDRTAYGPDPQTVCLSPEDMEMVKCMLVDVCIGNGFPGYHVDLEAASGTGTMDVTFIMRK